MTHLLLAASDGGSRLWAIVGLAVAFAAFALLAYFLSRRAVRDGELRGVGRFVRARSGEPPRV